MTAPVHLSLNEPLQHEGYAMQTVVHTTSHADRLQSYALFAALFPPLLAAEGVGRLISRLAATDEAQATRSRSMLADARDNASIAISYAVWARKTLQAFVRESRAERLS